MGKEKKSRKYRNRLEFSGEKTFLLVGKLGGLQIPPYYKQETNSLHFKELRKDGYVTKNTDTSLLLSMLQFYLKILDNLNNYEELILCLPYDMWCKK